MGIFNTFLSFSSHGCKEMLNMFTISIGSALVVSLETKIKILGIFE